MAQLMDALDRNFEGDEAMLHQIQRLPKFGNDEPYVDQLVDDVLAFTSGEIEKIPGFYGAKSTCAAATITGNIPMGADVGALPDGRLAGEPLPRAASPPTRAAIPAASPLPWPQ